MILNRSKKTLATVEMEIFIKTVCSWASVCTLNCGTLRPRVNFNHKVLFMLFMYNFVNFCTYFHGISNARAWILTVCPFSTYLLERKSTDV